MITLEQVIYILPLIALTTSIYYYALILRNSSKTRRTQVVMNLSNILSSPETIKNLNKLMSAQWDSFEEFQEKYDSTVNPDQYAIRWHIWRLYDHLGYMLHMGLVDVEHVYYLIGGFSILMLWNKYEPIIMEQRRYYHEEDWFKWWEYLVKEVSLFRVEQGLPKEIDNPDIYIKEF